MARAYLAPSLAQLRNEINARWPGRGRTSDGWIGDARHQARKSDHNPDGKGCVHAIDVDKDGIDPALLVATAIRDPRTSYVIWNRKIYSRTSGFKARAYHGQNAHTHHVHVSILSMPGAEANVAAWYHGGTPAPGPAAPRYPGRALVFKAEPGWRRMHGSDVRIWQARMRTLGRTIEVDGWYGPGSAGVARAFQHDRRLKVDGIVGPKTWAASWEA
jgi:hypothetical protein